MTWFPQVRKILEDRSAAKVDGMLVDSFTASALVQVHDALSPQNQAKFQAMPLLKAVTVAWKLIKGATA